ncbi:MAG TPA: DNA primase [Anaerolineae bacterium]|nr:DNA primase [Anaerolineae bacterium]
MTVIDDIKDRIDIIDIVSETVKLKKSGRTYTGFCPFHANSHTPSFVVWPETGTWKCFGACNTGGDVITYVMKRDGLEFKDALHALGRKAGIEVVDRKPDAEIEDQHIARLREAVAAAAQWYNFILSNNPQAQAARDHLSKRGLTAKTTEVFQLGYAPDDWHAFENQLRDKGFTREEMIDAGLLVSRDDGNVFDRFRNRLMIPIHDGKGRPIGFGARALKEGDEPKYLNSPQSSLFDKSRTLYGLHAARTAIRDQKVAVIVEGYMDALAAHQFGFANVVASLGTALTELQFKQLQKLTKRIVLALDPDTAGINAMLRGLDVARESLDRELRPVFDARGLIGNASKLDIDLRVLTLPGGQDPDEVMQHDPTQWNTLVDQAPPVAQFVIDSLTAGRNLNDPKEKAAIANQVLPIIRDIANPVEQNVYIQQLARKLKVDERSMFDQMRVAVASAARSRSRTAAQSIEPIKHDAADVEQYCLSTLLHRSDMLKVIDDALSRAELPALNIEDFAEAANREVFKAFQASLSRSPIIDDESLRSELDPTLHDHLSALINEAIKAPSGSTSNAIDQDAQQVGLRLRERRLRREGQELHALLEDSVNDQVDDAQALYQARQLNATALLRLQQILSARTITRQSTTEPWSRS